MKFIVIIKMLFLLGITSVHAENIPKLSIIKQDTEKLTDPDKVIKLLLDYAQSTNYYTGSGNFAQSSKSAHQEYRKVIESGRYLILSYEKPYFLTIHGHKEVVKDLFVDEIVFPITPKYFPLQPFLILSNGQLVHTAKSNGKLANDVAFEFGAQLRKSN